MKSTTSERTGGAIRKLRLAKGLTLAELSVQSGIPLSTLSRVELGQNALNADKLMRLCRALEVDLQGLVTREADGVVVASGRRAVIRAGTGQSVRLGGNTGRRAADDLLAKAFSPLIIEVTARNLDSHGPLAVLNGEVYLMVLDGEVILHSSLYAPLPMRTGDGVYFDGASGHAIIAPDKPAKVLLIAAGEQAFGA
jgi:transcriptional regulator with XRE-family HTH domain